MYRIPEKQFRKPNGLELRYTLFLSVCKSPTQSLTFHRTEISWLFLPLFDLLRFILYYFVQAEFFHANLRFQKEKTSRKRCVYNHGNLSLFRFTYAYMQITVHPPDFAGDKNVDFEFPDACLFGHPFYFGYQDFKS